MKPIFTVFVTLLLVVVYMDNIAPVAAENENESTMHSKCEFFCCYQSTSFVLLVESRMVEIARNYIAKYKKSSILRVFPGEWLDRTLDAIYKAAALGVKSAQTARKLLTSNEYNKDSK